MPILPSSADVPTVSPRVAADPGLQAPAAAFESPLGVAAEELLPAAKKFEEIKLKQINRDDAISLSKAVQQKNLENTLELGRLQTDSDLSDKEVLKEYGAFLSNKTRDAVESFAGSEDGRARLETRLNGIDATFIGRAAGISVTTGNTRAEASFDESLNPIIQRAAQNPSDLMLDQTFQDIETLMGDHKGAFNPDRENVKREEAQELAVLNTVNGLMAQDRFEEALYVLDGRGFIQSLSPNNQINIRKQINAAQEAKRNEIRSRAAVTASFGVVATKDAGDIKAGQFFTAIRTKEGIFRQAVDNDGRIKQVPVNSEDIRPVSTQQAVGLGDLQPGKTEQKEIRDQEVAAQTLMSTISTTLDLLEENPDINTFVARTASFVNDMQQEAIAVARLMDADIDANLLDPAGYEKEFDKLGIENARMRSLITSLAFQAAAASGQTGRAISNKDIERFITEIGASSSDPRAFSQVLVDVASRTIDRIKLNRLLRTGEQVEGDFGLSELSKRITKDAPKAAPSDKVKISEEDEALILKYTKGNTKDKVK